MTQLTPDNWKEHLKDNRINSYDQITQGHIESFIDQLLALQKQALKDEAVKKIEEEVQLKPFTLSVEEDLYNTGMVSGLIKAQDIIRNL